MAGERFDVRRSGWSTYALIPDDPGKRAAVLLLIADCIEGKVKFSRGGAYSQAEQRRLVIAAWMVEHRAGGTPVGEAMEAAATRLQAAGNAFEGQDVQNLRDQIARCRKEQRKNGWPLLNAAWKRLEK